MRFKSTMILPNTNTILNIGYDIESTKSTHKSDDSPKRKVYRNIGIDYDFDNSFVHLPKFKKSDLSRDFVRKLNLKGILSAKSELPSLKTILKNNLSAGKMLFKHYSKSVNDQVNFFKNDVNLIAPNYDLLNNKSSKSEMNHTMQTRVERFLNRKRRNKSLCNTMTLDLPEYPSHLPSCKERVVEIKSIIDNLKLPENYSLTRWRNSQSVLKSRKDVSRRHLLNTIKMYNQEISSGNNEILLNLNIGEKRTIKLRDLGKRLRSIGDLTRKHQRSTSYSKRLRNITQTPYCNL